MKPWELVEGIILRAVAAVLGVRVTSWMRSPAYNARIGGHPKSKHLTGGAIDVGPETSPEKRAVLRSLAREVDETTAAKVKAHGGGAGSTGSHYHYQVDGRMVPAIVAALVAVFAFFVTREERRVE